MLRRRWHILYAYILKGEKNRAREIYINKGSIICLWATMLCLNSVMQGQLVDNIANMKIQFYNLLVRPILEYGIQF